MPVVSEQDPPRSLEAAKTTKPLAERRQPRRGRPVWSIWFLLALAAMAILVLGPILIMLMISFQEQAFGQAPIWGIQQWVDALAGRRLGTALWNTISLSATRQAIAMVVGVFVAWLVARTDLPFAKTLEYGFWIAVFMPSLTITISWILVLDPVFGIANRLITMLPFVEQGPFNIYSWWGIIWANLLSSTLPIKVMLLAPAFSNLDAAYEEASRSVGASTFQTLRRIVLPLLAPSMLVALVLGMIRSMESFEIELVLGMPVNIEVLSTRMYRLARSAPPMYSQATVVAMMSLVVMLPAVVFQRRYTTARGHATLTGRATATRRPLGRWRWPAFAGVALLVAMMVVFPVAMVIMGTFMRFFGRFEINNPWTTAHWQSILSSPTLSNAFKNSLLLGAGTALVAVTVFSVFAYLIVRTNLKGRALLDYFVWFPSMVPGIVIGLGYLILFVNVPFLRPLYGTIMALIVVSAMGAITLTTQMIKASLIQLGSELEEASRSVGGGWLATFKNIVLPLIAPTLVVVGMIAFSVAIRATGHVALLSTRNNQPLSILQLNQMADFNLEAASVVGVIILTVTIGVALIARWLGLRFRGVE